MRALPVLLVALSCYAADPTFLRRSVGQVQPKPDDLTPMTKGASYKPPSRRGGSRCPASEGDRAIR